MTVLRYYVDVTADGAHTDWSPRGQSDGAACVPRESSDGDYIASATVGANSNFDCGTGPFPPLGFVTGVRLGCRALATDLAGVPDFTVDLYRGGVLLSSATVVPTLAWVDTATRLTTDPVSGLRFTSADLVDLGIGVTVTTAPTAGEIWVSGLWIEVEWAISPEYYDPLPGVLPNIIAGDMAWVKAGGQVGAIVGDDLVLSDASAVDFLNYTRTIANYDERTVTEVTTRFNITSASSGFIFRLARVDDGTRDIDCCCFASGGTAYVGLASGTADRNVLAEYLVAAALDWTEDHHYRLEIDRSLDLSVSHNVRLYCDYAETPLLEARYTEFDASITNRLQFGSGDATYVAAISTTDVSFYDWRHYVKEGGGWKYWTIEETGTNAVTRSSTEASIIHKVLIPPINIWAGQSDYCAVLAVADPTELCEIRNYLEVAVGGTYDLTLDYRSDTAGIGPIVAVQRTSDHYYWNDGISAWQAAASTISPGFVGTRTATSIATGITAAALADAVLILRFFCDPGAGGAHNIYLYKVDLRD